MEKLEHLPAENLANFTRLVFTDDICFENQLEQNNLSDGWTMLLRTEDVIMAFSAGRHCAQRISRMEH